ncbi:tryptophan 7-halogenase [Aliiglaciecola sp. 2_MG-2023]|uniref:tryptophan halogenase family protein n=1 Tax=unclassified Aliiglaciecola TaxID=2593648 RepID=UPI0026E3889E|nr:MULTISPECIES: tryptophan halogenase family protein [unclassified Aliiglaciecola]MDO6710764.1 tryptophan 7-halogenase [Aliiglaciecola sp. 2_MG-2023]MDO6751828.1 tryptophan 7-halogenase [Aliiglaciecola sp. 1_MG-2023]
MDRKGEQKVNRKIKNVVIAGGGTAGWIAAAALAKQMPSVINVTLVESEEIGTVGVGEATIPPMRVFNKLLGIDESQFMAETSATFKLGIQFDNWGKQGDSYIHSFGMTGKESFIAPFHHFWLYGKEQGVAKDFGKYCFELEAAKANKFALSDKSSINYAYHLDSSKYAAYLRKFSEFRGVKRIEGKIAAVNKDPKNGFITSLKLDSGQLVEGDLFIDCTGFRGLLIEQALHTGYEDWSHWLPCDSAIAVQTKSVGEVSPITRSIAHHSGWQWRIPLQHRVGNGIVYCSKYMTDEQAKEYLLSNIEGEVITEPRVIKYRTGRRRKHWNKNCLALGLASGFVEPLESTSIHLIMMGIIRLLRLFPCGEISDSVIDEYNQQATDEIEKIRDFIVLHYHVTQRQDSEFWRHCKSMEVPESLAHRIRLFTDHAHAFQADGELFRVDSWTQVMLGQGIEPKQYHPSVQGMPVMELEKFLSSLEQSISKAVSQLPSHQRFIQQYCSPPN